MGWVAINMWYPPTLVLEIRTEPPDQEIHLDGRIVGRGKVLVKLPMIHEDHGPNVDGFPMWADHLGDAIGTAWSRLFESNHEGTTMSAVFDEQTNLPSESSSRWFWECRHWNRIVRFDDSMEIVQDGKSRESCLGWEKHFSVVLESKAMPAP